LDFIAAKREQYELSRDEQAQLEHIVEAGTVLRALKEEKAVAKDATWKNIPFYKPKEGGATPSGYAGRIGIYEVMPVTSTIKELMMKNGGGEELEKQARSEGMLSMSEDGIFKAAQGVTTIEEVLRVITE
jgi:type IV pilus assembly protein PilB